MFLASTFPPGDWLLVHVRVDSTSIAIMRGSDVIFYRNRSEGEAETLTDGLRAMLLESQGYSTKVFEFVSSEHTPKNTMIAAVRNVVEEMSVRA